MTIIDPAHSSLGTNFAMGMDSPRPWLRMMAQAGFTHVHWAHHWKSTINYGTDEMVRFAGWLKEFGLLANDIHAAQGAAGGYGSPQECHRLAGVELVLNRIDLAGHLACDVIVLHLPVEPDSAELRALYWDALRRSFDALEPYARKRGVRIALENLARYTQSFPQFQRLFSLYDADFLGLCYDAGHGNINSQDGKYDFHGEGLDLIAEITDRMIAFHLNDNDGTGDQHLLPFHGTVNWKRLAEIIARSGYPKSCLTWEVLNRNVPAEHQPDFLAKALQGSRAFADMVLDSR